MVFDKYDGPLFTPDGGVPCVDSKERPAVPILPERQDFIYKSNTCWREQFPLIVSYAITVHKAQGVTLDRAVCDISVPEFSSGLSYVAVSRVSMLKGLMFDSPFSMARVFRDPPGKMMQLRINDYIRRQGCFLSQQAPSPTHPFDDEESMAEESDVEDGPSDEEDKASSQWEGEGNGQWDK